LYVEVLLAVSDFVRGLVVAAISYFLAALYLMTGDVMVTTGIL
jgi:hypothetical protein